MRSLSVWLFLTVVVTAGCTQEPEPPPEEARLQVRLLTSAAVSGRWERAAERGLGRIASELEAEIARIRVADARRPLAELGVEPHRADLVFCVGPGLASSLPSVAPRLPGVLFVQVPGTASGRSVAGIEFRARDAAYLAGVLAGTVDRSRVAGLVRGQGRSWLEPVEAGFRTGFLAARARGEVRSETGAEAPWTLVEAGAATALYAADRPEKSVLAAAHNAGLALVTLDRDLFSVEPDVVLAAIHLDVAEAMLRVARSVAEGDRTARTHSFDLTSGVVDLEINPASPVAADPEVARTLAAARAAVTSGVVEIESLGL